VAHSQWRTHLNLEPCIVHLAGRKGVDGDARLEVGHRFGVDPVVQVDHLHRYSEPY
jgi:hypothetical protein